MLVSGTSYLAAFDKPQLDALTMVFIRLHSLGWQVAGGETLILPQVGILGDVGGLLEFGEPPIILWLLIWGAKQTRNHP